ncbi:MAG: dimethyl sulfoxide reductase anchor subunit [Verrucomicrobia bacterium]|nr:dimethyl sulfoxide reductase anchor subunit [Verrucomicrobiota bacterium]
MSIEAPPAPSTQPAATGSLASFLSELLLEQQRLQTPVAQFAALHEHGLASPSSRPLIPLTAPGPGEQYAFEVDLDACSGCKACVSACHSLNGLDDNEAWRDVGLIHGGTTAAPYQQTITTACHHCADPACLNGCPVVAYEKDPITGIVRHLDDQCIGCSYCILKCPYDVPKYNARLGIVRKCDMCQQRLAVGEAPACVQACPTHAISIVKVSTFSANTDFLAAAPAPEYTRPTTSYRSKLEIPANATAADASTLYVQHAHAPLVAMLTLTQLAVGLLATAPLLSLPENVNGDLLKSVTYYVTLPSEHTAKLLGFALLFAGLGASVLHLGQPTRAWRFFLGLRTSWLSREILVFSAFAPLALSTLLWPNSNLLRAAVATTGVVGVICSAMIYIDTRRRFWAPLFTHVRFLGTAVIAALIPIHSPATIVTLFVKLCFELRQALGSGVSARLQRGPLLPVLVTRFTLGAGALIALLTNQSTAAFALFAAGEIAERTLFFKAVDSPKMPGHPVSP